MTVLLIRTILLTMLYTSGQIGEEPRSAPEEQTNDLTNERMKAARKISRDM
jgi:enamine deaminase RidA (YjgF/YER057c/UK114 family)